jgi:hypothetical protein
VVLNVPSSTVRGWLRRIVSVADEAGGEAAVVGHQVPVHLEDVQGHTPVSRIGRLDAADGYGRLLRTASIIARSRTIICVGVRRVRAIRSSYGA